MRKTLADQGRRSKIHPATAAAQAAAEGGPIVRPVALADLELLGRLADRAMDRAACRDERGMLDVGFELQQLAIRLCKRPTGGER